MKNFYIVFLLLFILSGCTDGGEIEFTPHSLNTTTSTVPVTSTRFDARINVESGKLFRIRVNKGGLYEEPLKYRAIVRLDPRLSAPNIFVTQMNGSSGQYAPSWTEGGANFQTNLTSLLSLWARNVIPVHSGDAVSYKILDASSFYDSSMTLRTSDLTGRVLQNYNYLDLSSVVTGSGGVDNAIINSSDIRGFCAYNPSSCVAVASGKKPSSNLLYSQFLLGLANFTNIQSLASCNVSSTNITALCKYDLGRGLEFRVNATLVKNWDKSFVDVADNGVIKKVYYHVAETDGNLNFTFPSNIASYNAMFSNTVTTAARTDTETNTTSSCTPYTRSCEGLNCGTTQVCYKKQPDNNLSSQVVDCYYYDYCNNKSWGWGWWDTEICGTNFYKNPYSKETENIDCCTNGNKTINIPDQITASGVRTSIGTVNVNVSNGIVTTLNNVCRDVTTSRTITIPASTVTTTFANQYASSWLGAGYDSRSVMNIIASSSTPYQLAKYAAGRYLFEIDVGSSTGAVLQQKLQNVKLHYTIEKDGVVLASGVVNNDLLEINAPATGNIFLSVVNPYQEIHGSIVAQTQTYTESAVISEFLNDSLVAPLKEQLLNVSAEFFSGLVHNGQFILFVQTCLTIYLIFYGFGFAIGSIEITINDMVTRIVKILVVSALFSSTSWSFFNQYLFVNFLNSTDQLINAVANQSGVAGNIFGFIDPMLHKYFDKNLWSILGIYILFAAYGYILPAALIIMGIYYFLRAIISIFIGYLMAYLSLCVMIAMAPLFITAMLFERTKDYFDNWISVMFGYMIQPFLIMVFMLFIDQISTDLLANGLTTIRFGCIWEVGFYTSNPDIDLDFFCVEGYYPYPLSTPVATIYRVSALFFCVMKLASQVVVLSEAFADRLTVFGGSAEGAISGGGVGGKYGVTAMMQGHLAGAAKFVAAKSAKTAWRGIKSVGRKIGNRMTSTESKSEPTEYKKTNAVDPYSMEYLEKKEIEDKTSAPEGMKRVAGEGGYDTFEPVQNSPKGTESKQAKKWMENPIRSSETTQTESTSSPSVQKSPEKVAELNDLAKQYKGKSLASSQGRVVGSAITPSASAPASASVSSPASSSAASSSGAGAVTRAKPVNKAALKKASMTRAKTAAQQASGKKPGGS